MNLRFVKPGRIGCLGVGMSAVWLLANPVPARVSAQGSPQPILTVLDPGSTSLDPAQEAFALAVGSYERGDWASAASSFRAFIDRFPNDTRVGPAWFYTGESLLQAGDLSSSRAAFQHYLRRGDRPEWREKALFRVAELSARTGAPEACRMLESFLSSHPQSQWREYALYSLGAQRLERDEPQLAERVYTAALQEFPNSTLTSEFLLGAAVACRARGELAAARGYLTRLPASDDREIADRAGLEWSRVLILENDHAAALAALKRLIDSNDLPSGRLAEVKLLTGTCQLQTGDLLSAVENLEQARELVGEDELAAAATWHLSAAWVRLEKPEQARRELEVLTERWPEHALARSARLGLVEASVRTGDWQRSIELADEALAGPGGKNEAARVLELKGRALYAAGDFLACRKTFDQLLQEYPQASSGERAVWTWFAGSSRIGLGESAEAIQLLRGLNPADLGEGQVTAWQRALASALLGAKKFHEAAGILAEIDLSSLDPVTAQEVRHDRLVAHALAGEMDACEQNLAEWWSGEKGSQRAMEWARALAERAATAGRMELAERCYRMISDAPAGSTETRSRALAALAWLELQSGNPDEALNLFESLTRDYPSSTAAAEAWIAMASIHEKRESWEVAGWLYGHAAEKSASDSARQIAAFRQAVMLRKQGNAGAISRGGVILQALAKDSGNAIPKDELLYELAWFEQHRGQPAESIAIFERLVNEVPGSPLWPDAALRLATSRIEQADHAGALELLSQITARSDAPSEIVARAWFQLGQLASREDNWSRTGTCMENVLAARPEQELELRARYWLAESQFRLKQFSAALSGFVALQANESGFSPSIAPWLWLRAAQCQLQLERWDEVVRTCEDGRSRYPDFAQAWEFDFLVARERFSRGLFDDAIAGFEKVTRDPRSKGGETAAQAQWLIGESLFHQEKYAAAVEAFHRVDSLYSSAQWRAAAFLQAGKCQEHLGNRKQAAALYTQLIARFPDSELVTSARTRLELLGKTAARVPAQPVSRKREAGGQMNK